MRFTKNILKALGSEINEFGRMTAQNNTTAVDKITWYVSVFETSGNFHFPLEPEIAREELAEAIE